MSNSYCSARSAPLGAPNFAHAVRAEPIDESLPPVFLFLQSYSSIHHGKITPGSSNVDSEKLGVHFFVVKPYACTNDLLLGAKSVKQSTRRFQQISENGKMPQISCCQ